MSAAIETSVVAVLLSIAQTHRPELATLAVEAMLVDDLQFDSLDLAQAVAELEVQLGLDPFATTVTIASVRTVGDFVAAYCQAGA